MLELVNLKFLSKQAMSLDPTTIRWKLDNSPDSLSSKECDYLSDLVTEKLGFQAPDKDAKLAHVTPDKVTVIKTPEGDPYREVYARSPNQGGKIKPKYIIVHDSYGSHDGTRSWILQRRSKVSYHYLIASNGDRTQFVYDTNRAYHAGRSYWKGTNGLNQNSVGISFWGNTREREPSFKEIDSCAHKIVYLMKKFGIPRENILTHKQIAPNRKNDTAPDTMQRVLAQVDKLL